MQVVNGELVIPIIPFKDDGETLTAELCSLVPDRKDPIIRYKLTWLIGTPDVIGYVENGGEKEWLDDATLNKLMVAVLSTMQRIQGGE